MTRLGTRGAIWRELRRLAVLHRCDSGGGIRGQTPTESREGESLVQGFG